MRDLIDFLTNNTSLYPYKGKIEEVGAEGVTFLDTFVYKGPSFSSNHILSAKPHLRQKGKFLHTSSCHSTNVHFSWPTAYCLRLRTISTAHADFIVAKEWFLAQLRKSHFGESYIGWLDKQTQFMSSKNVSVSERRRDSCTVWQPFPFHPVLSPLIAKAMRECVQRPSNHALLFSTFAERGVPNLRTSWRLSGRRMIDHLMQW